MDVVGPSGGSGTLQSAYDAGTAGIVQVITLGGGGRLGVAIRDAAAPIVGNLFEVTDNGDTVKYLAVTPTGVRTSGLFGITSAAGVLEWSESVAAGVATQTVADTTFGHAFTQTTAATSGTRSFLTVTGAQNTN
jgi:hypothetical protein